MVADYLVNDSASPPDPLFRYSSASGEITATDDAAREQIIRVEADLHVDPDPAKRPLAAHITSSVVLRNQNRAPSAFFSSRRHEPARLHAAAQRLRLRGPREQAADLHLVPRRRAARHRPAEPASLVQLTAPTGAHTYRLEVKDPAGLAATPYEKGITACT